MLLKETVRHFKAPEVMTHPDADDRGSTSGVRPALFMSSKCRYCGLFLAKLNEHNLLDEVDIIDVLKTPIDVSKVRSVPTMVIDGQRVAVGREAFGWLLRRIKSIPIDCMSSEEMGCAFTYVSDAAGRDDQAYGATTSVTHVGLDTPEPPLSESLPSVDDGKSIDERLSQLRMLRGQQPPP